MTLREILVRRDAIAAELRALNPEADTAAARMTELEAELGTLATRQRQIALVDDLDRNAPARDAENRGTVEGEAVYGLRAAQKMAEYHRATTGQETRGLSAGRYIAARLTGRWNGAEAEQRVMASNDGTTGGFLIPDAISANVIDLIRANSGLIAAGALTIPMPGPNMRVVKVVSDPTAAFRGEGQTIAESDGAFEALNLHAYSVAALVRVNNELLDDVPTFGPTLDAMISGALAVKMDSAALYGTGAGQPLGLRNDPGLSEVSMGGNGALASSYDEYLDVLQKITEANGTADAVIFAPRTSTKLAKLVTGIASDKTKLVPPAAFAALRKITSNQVSITETQGNSNVASTAFVGGFANMAVAIRQGITIEATRVADDAFAKNQTLIRAIARFDVATFRPALIGRLVGIL
jgi:HK97 family phage major capsid protein